MQFWTGSVLPQPQHMTSMKNTFVISSLVLAFGYPTAVAANMIGVVSSSLPSLPAFIGFYAAAGILLKADH